MPEEAYIVRVFKIDISDIIKPQSGQFNEGVILYQRWACEQVARHLQLPTSEIGHCRRLTHTGCIEHTVYTTNKKAALWLTLNNHSS
jgi:hypothetical protein